MVGSQPARASAKRIRSHHAPANDATKMTVTCEKCGELFGIEHSPEAAAIAIASRQAKWLAEQFVWDHIQENKHKASITLPLL